MQCDFQGRTIISGEFSDVEKIFRSYTARTALRESLWNGLYLKRQGGNFEASPLSK